MCDMRRSRDQPQNARSWGIGEGRLSGSGAAASAHQQHASTPLLALTQQLFTAALHELGDQPDYIEVAKVIAAMNGTKW